METINDLLTSSNSWFPTLTASSRNNYSHFTTLPFLIFKIRPFSFSEQCTRLSFLTNMEWEKKMLKPWLKKWNFKLFKLFTVFLLWEPKRILTFTSNSLYQVVNCRKKQKLLKVHLSSHKRAVSIDQHVKAACNKDEIQIFQKNDVPCLFYAYTFEN